MFFKNFIYHKPASLFGTQNAKTIKGEKLGYTTFIMYLSPHNQNTLNKSICPKSTAGCQAACLFTAGRGVFTKTKMARLNKTEYFLHDKKHFMEQLANEIARGYKKYGKTLAVRLNGTSDIAYEKIPVYGFESLMAMFPDVQFYDYTKIFGRLNHKLPKNYHLTFSRDETNDAECKLALQFGFNVASVFKVKDVADFPKKYMNANIVSGDEHDLTFLHGNGNVVALKAKGQAKKDTTGFVITKF